MQSNWNQTWAVIFPRLVDELPPEVLAPLRVKFNLGGATSISNFFNICNGRAKFTGTNAKDNLELLLSVFSTNMEWSALPSVQRLRESLHGKTTIQSAVDALFL